MIPYLVYGRLAIYVEKFESLRVAIKQCCLIKIRSFQNVLIEVSGSGK